MFPVQVFQGLHRHASAENSVIPWIAKALAWRSIDTMRSAIFIISPFLFALLSSCFLITVPVKIAGKVVTTTVKVAGKAAGAGIDAVRKDDDDKKDEKKKTPDDSAETFAE